MWRRYLGSVNKKESTSQVWRWQLLCFFAAVLVGRSRAPAHKMPPEGQIVLTLECDVLTVVESKKVVCKLQSTSQEKYGSMKSIIPTVTLSG